MATSKSSARRIGSVAEMLNKVLQSSGSSLRELKQRAFDALPKGERDDELWLAAMRAELSGVDLNADEFRQAIAVQLVAKERRDRSFTPPGTSDQLDMLALTPEVCNNAIIVLPDNMSVPLTYANRDHLHHGFVERQKKAIEMQLAVVRYAELMRLGAERGGLAAALRRRGVPGW